jgi:hypothetical protein
MLIFQPFTGKFLHGTSAGEEKRLTETMAPNLVPKIRKEKNTKI